MTKKKNETNEEYNKRQKDWRSQSIDKVKIYRSKTSEYIKEYNKIYQPIYRKLNPPIVYAFFNQEGQALYVGKGRWTRPKAHKTKSSWWSKDLILLTMTCKDEWEAMEMEGKWGGKYQPLFNKKGNRY